MLAWIWLHKQEHILQELVLDGDSEGTPTWKCQVFYAIAKAFLDVQTCRTCNETHCLEASQKQKDYI